MTTTDGANIEAAPVRSSQRLGFKSGRGPGRPRGRTARAAWIDVRQRLFKVVTFLDQNPELGHDMNRLAELVGMSRVHLAKSYRRHVGEAPGQTALRLRLTRARDQLAAGQSVATVATAAGYAAVDTFAAAFHRRYAVHPQDLLYVSRLPCIPPRLAWLDERTLYGVPAAGSRLKFTPAIEEGLSSLLVKNDEMDSREAFVLMRDMPFFQGDGSAMNVSADEVLKTNDPVGAYDAVVPASQLKSTRGLERMMVSGGAYLLVHAYGNWARVARALLDAITRLNERSRYRLRNDPVIWRGINDPWLTPPSERLRDIYIPIRPI